MINNSKLLYFLSFLLMLTIREDEEVADNDSETTTLVHLLSLFLKVVLKSMGESSVSYQDRL